MPEPTDQEAISPNSAPSPRGESLIRRLGPAGPLALVAATMPALGGFALIAYMPTVSAWLASHQGTGVWIYISAFAVLAGLALLPTYAQAALGGYAFGVGVGVGAALAGFAAGAVIGYEIARRASGDRVMRVLHERPALAAVRDALVKDQGRGSFIKTVGMVALLRMPPNSPFAVTNLVMASVKVPRAAYVIGTVLGMLPRTAAAVWIGHLVAQSARNFDKGSLGEATPNWVYWGGIGLTVAVLVVVMVIADRALKRIHKGAASAAAAARESTGNEQAG